MTSSRPYLLRTLYEWIVDNNKTPFIVINADVPNTFVPREYVHKGQIVLNVAPEAVFDLIIDNIELQFNASFSGMSRHISAPIEAIMAIYAKETNEGMTFGDEPGGDSPPDNSKFTSSKDKGAKKPQLKVIK